ncbi:Quinone oxidoreductase [Colletotrichum chlorophyti]|uniref:Quinone oxidoreductase n=1 Tax=Colletotrichum chlorophyti TaxID=708187 RepID=A0A1Q8S6E2_9PEZI|nr:Quinone oxidoreductase [Colletotrichum chlorophyti]
MSSTQKMKAVVISKSVSDFKDIEVAEIDQPLPGPDHYLIQVKAAGVNFVDTLYAKGKHQNNRSVVRPPFVLGREFSGTILSAPSFSDYRPGDRVFGAHAGSYSEVISLPASTHIHSIPPSWSFSEAAGVAAILPVSYAALLHAGIKTGQTILVHAAAGGLGSMAVQVAKALGCRVIGTAGSPEKCDIAIRSGADACVNYNQELAWWARVLDLTDGKGVDVVFDSVGLVDGSLKCVAHRGKILVVGFAGIRDGMERIAMNRILLKQVSLIGYRYGESLRRYPDEENIIWNGLKPLIQNGCIRPIVFHPEYHGLDQVPRALSDMSGRQTWGKAVVTLGCDALNTDRARL